MNAQVSPEEQEQILQTIEMFEVITQSSPHDCQSLEILKEAYARIGKHAEAIAITKRLADTYAANGEYSSALLEYEGILKQEPDSLEILDLLRSVEAKLQESGQTLNGHAQDFDQVLMDDDPMQSTLIRTTSTKHFQVAGTSSRPAEVVLPTPENDGNEPLAKFLIQHRIVPEDIVKLALTHVQKMNQTISQGDGVAFSLLAEIARTKTMTMEQLLSGILDRAKFAYAPLEYYDVDRQIVKMLPENLTLGRLIVPFDLVSRTVMVALANPFDALGKEAVQQLLDYNIQWHLASPEAIAKVLRETHRLEARD